MDTSHPDCLQNTLLTSLFGGPEVLQYESFSKNRPAYSQYNSRGQKSLAIKQHLDAPFLCFSFSSLPCPVAHWVLCMQSTAQRKKLCTDTIYSLIQGSQECIFCTSAPHVSHSYATGPAMTDQHNGQATTSKVSGMKSYAGKFNRRCYINSCRNSVCLSFCILTDLIPHILFAYDSFLWYLWSKTSSFPLWWDVTLRKRNFLSKRTVLCKDFTDDIQESSLMLKGCFPRPKNSAN